MTVFSRTPRSDSHYLIKITVQGIGRSLSRYPCLMLRSLFPTNDNNNSEYSNQLNKILNATLHWQVTIQRIFFRWLKIASSMLWLVSTVNYHKL